MKRFFAFFAGFTEARHPLFRYYSDQALNDAYMRGRSISWWWLLRLPKSRSSHDN